MIPKEYTDEELIEEITFAIEEMGGNVTAVDLENNIFRLTIDPDLQQEAHMLIIGITNKYKEGRTNLLMTNPFVRVKEIRKRLFG